MGHTMTPEAADKEKRAAALSSVFAAILLTGLKLVVGVSTNSLGILSEAAHSALDLLAAGVTYGAVRYASLPPDPGHPYGHGKIENLSALVEAVLLLVTCGWIVWEAVDRLFFNPAIVRPSLWAVGVMVISIVVDISRSRMLKRVAKKHRSQALEADALHFSTDILSSAVVLVGLGALYAASLLPEHSVWRPWLERADALAAIGVSFIVLHVSLQLGRRAVDVLLDAGDTRISAAIEKVLQTFPGITRVLQVRVRHSGPQVFTELMLEVPGNLVMEEAQHIQSEAKALVLGVEPAADVSVQLVPQEGEQRNNVAYIRTLAASYGLAVHSVEMLDTEDSRQDDIYRVIQLHVEMDPQATLAEAHQEVSRFEQRLAGDFPGVAIVSHIEPRLEKESGVCVMPPEMVNMDIEAVIGSVVAAQSNVKDVHHLRVRVCGGETLVSFHCRMQADKTVEEAHEAASAIQTAMHQRLPELKQVTVHMEPSRDSE